MKEGLAYAIQSHFFRETSLLKNLLAFKVKSRSVILRNGHMSRVGPVLEYAETCVLKLLCNLKLDGRAFERYIAWNAVRKIR